MVNYSDNAKAIYKKLYLQSNESIEECHYRVAKALANNEEEAEKFKKLLDEQIVRLNTPCMINAGTNNEECWHACFILGLEDSMDSIISMWEICTRIYKGGGGAGIPISNLREKGAPISTGGHASGPISYMKVIQEISNQVKSGGRTRRAANLASFRYNHPDVLDFIDLKRNKDGKFSAFNTSVLVDNNFMENANSSKFLELKGVNTEKTVNKITYKGLWTRIVEAAWECGDPGLLFYDRVNEDNPFPSLGDIVSTNPCGEVAGPPWTVCCLGHLNLNKILRDDKLDFDLMEEYVETLVCMLNRMLERSPYPHENFRNRMLQTRPIGIGVMGFADILYKKRVPYNSKQAVQIFDFICHKLTNAAFKTSHKYALKNKIKIDIPEEDRKHFFNYLSKFVGKDKANLYIKEGLANSTVTCIAPTGSTAISADCSYSFEPQFALIWQKKLEDGGSMIFINEEFEKACNSLGIKLTETLIDDIKANKGSIKGLIKKLDDVFVVAHDIEWDDRLKMQAAGQEWITQSISSTVNLPNSATVEDIANIYKRAWELGLKGITVFRDGCLDTQPVDFGGGSGKKAKRPSTLKGITRKMNTGYGTLYLTINELNSKPFEVFAILGKSGRDEAASAEAIGRLVSLCLRSDIPVEEIVRQLEGIGGESQIFSDHSLVKSIPDAIAKMLKNYISNNMETKSSDIKSENKNVDKSRICPNCGSLTFIRSGSCRGGTCLACGYSKCE